jgi:hypothetical protein
MLDLEKTNPEDKLTRQQQKSLFKWLGQIAQVLNENGITLNQLLMTSLEVPATKENLHKDFVKPLIDKIYNQKSTTEIKKIKQIDQLIDIITLNIGREFGISVPSFPSLENESFVDTYKIK